MDDTQLKILTTIKEELKTKTGKEFGIELGIEEIDNIKDFQFYGLLLGISKEMDIHLPKIGKFLFTNRKKRKQEKKEVLSLLKAHEEANPNFDREAALRIFIKQWAIDTEDAIKNRDTSTTSLNEILDTPVKNNSNLRIFGKLSKLNQR